MERLALVRASLKKPIDEKFGSRLNLALAIAGDDLSQKTAPNALVEGGLCSEHTVGRSFFRRKVRIDVVYLLVFLDSVFPASEKSG